MPNWKEIWKMEHYSINLTQSAQADIRDIAGYISLELRVPLTAKKLLRRFREAISSLETMPERYALVSDGYLATRGFRAVSVEEYLLFYTVDRSGRRVNVSRVLCGKRDWVSILTKDL